MKMTQTMTQTLTRGREARRSRWLRAAALAALPIAAAAFIVAPQACAQTQQNTTGRALDANNRIGSGGTNTFRPPPNVGVYGNNVITGNVTQGREFHGFVGYSDPNEFHGPVPRTVGDFQRDSVGVGVPNTPPPPPNQSQIFFSEARVAPPPLPGFSAITTPGVIGYAETKPLVVQPNDPRLGAHLDALPTTTVPRPGEMVLPGPVDPTSNQQTVLSASPLTGVRQFSTADQGDLSYLTRFTGLRSDNPLDRIKMSAEDVQRARQELRGGGTVPGTTGIGAPSENGGATPPAPGGAGTGADLSAGPQSANLARPLGQPLESPADPLLANRRVDASVQSSAVGASVSTNEGGVYTRLLGAPEKQSTQYDELKKRLERYQGEHRTAAERSADRFNAAVRAKTEADAKAALAAKKPEEVKLPGTTDTTAGAKNPTETPGTTVKEAPKPPPLQVKSMATGIQGKGLKEMLDKAEGLMKDGKFTNAIDEYAAAEQVAPNQPLVWIGRANAELGASYYNRAEQHLKQAFASDKALLMAQYDLRAMLGEDRLQSVIKDLKEIASSDQASPTPVFLLAYIAYNTGNERRAAGYLDLAERRSGGKDPVFKLLREHWSLPTTDQSTTEPKAPELNK